MIEVTDINGRKVYIAPSAIAIVAEAGASSQWHGVKAIIRTFDGKTLEVRESAQELAKMLAGTQA